LKKGLEIEILIDHMKYPNIGVGYIDGNKEEKKIVIKNTIRGQYVKAKITKNRSNKTEARLLEVIEKSSIEKDSFCEHYGNCGGCALQTLSDKNQAQLKLEMIQELFKSNGLLVVPEKIIDSPKVFEYRNKMEYSFGDEFIGGPLTLGMHKKNRHNDVVNIPNCHLIDEDFRNIMTAVLNYFTVEKAPKYNKRSGEGFLRHLVVRKGLKTGEIMVALSATTQWSLNKRSFVEMLNKLNLKGVLTSILYVHNDGLGDMVSGEIECLQGSETIRENLFDLTFDIPLYAFFQTNTLGAEHLYRSALEMIPNIGGKICFDLFSGTGTIGQIMAKKAKRVIGIEIVADAVEMAIKNAQINEIDNCEFLCGDVYTVLNTITDKPDVIVVDPPRMGIGEKAVKKIATYGVDEIVYISCNPKTLVDDLKTFETCGYTCEKVLLVDMFPWTGHVETVVKLQRRNP